MPNMFRSIVAVIAAIVSLFGLVQAAERPNREVEASMNFDLERVQPFLMRMTKVVEGFTAAQAATLANDIAKLDVDATLNRSYVVRFNGRSMTLRVKAFMDDVDAPDLSFFTEKTLARRIDLELQHFAKAQGW